MSHWSRPAWSLIGAAACWGVGTAMSKRAVAEIAPLTLLPVELTVGVAVLLVARVVTGDRALPTHHRSPLAWLGVLNPGVSYALGFAGLATITAGTSSLLWATEPVLILGLAWWILRQRPSARILWLGGLALAGVMLVVGVSDLRLSLVGVTLTMAGVAACAVYTVLASRYLSEQEPTLGVVVIQQSAALVFALLLGIGGLVAGSAAAPDEVSMTAWANALGAGALYYGLAFWWYLHGLRSLTPGVAGVFINLVPVFGISSSAIFLGERLSGWQWIGAAVTVAAVTAVAILQTRNPPHARAA
jgi:probable blue pigment (indigoidine) exporter